MCALLIGVMYSFVTWRSRLCRRDWSNNEK